MEGAKSARICSHDDAGQVVIKEGKYLEKCGWIGIFSITEAFQSYGSDILLAEVSYDREVAAGKIKHLCRIEKYE